MKFITILTVLICLLSNASLATDKLNNNSDNISLSNQLISIGVDERSLRSLDNPRFTDVINIKNLSEEEPVISVVIGDEARAYPLRYMLWHSVVNDIIEDRKIAVTYSPLTNISNVFDRKLDDKNILSLKDSGKRFKSNLVLSDKENANLWLQYDGKSLSGTKQKLSKIPVQIISFKIFKSFYKDGKIMIQPNLPKHYGMNPYKYYDSLRFPFFYDAEYKRKNISPMSYVLIVGDKAWSLSLLKQYNSFNQDNLIVQWIYGQRSVLDNPDIAKARDIGNVIVKQAYGEGLLRDVPYMVSFAFVFDAFNPNKIIYTQ